MYASFQSSTSSSSAGNVFDTARDITVTSNTTLLTDSISSTSLFGVGSSSSSNSSLNGQLIIPPQDPGSDLQNAFALTVGSKPITVKESSSATSGRFSFTDVDTYRFTLNETSNFSLSFNLSTPYGGTARASVHLLDSNGQRISEQSVANSQSISYSLAAGTYYISLFDTSQKPPQSSSSSLNYYMTLVANPFTPPPDLAGDSTSNARDITVNPTTNLLQDWIGGTVDSNDYYRFSLNDAADFNVIASGVNTRVNLKLLDSSGNLLKESLNAGNNSQGISRVLGAGVYYLQVSPIQGTTTGYNLSVWGTPFAVPTDNAGNAIANAREITLGSSDLKISDWIAHTVDDNDYYRFNLDQSSNFKLLLDGAIATTNVTLLDENSNILESRTANQYVTGNINRFLVAGTYYIQVNPEFLDDTIPTNYNLTVSTTPFAIPQDGAGNNQNSARDITVNANPTTFSDWISKDYDNKDYYRFNLENTSNLNVQLDGFTGPLDLSLLDSNGNYIVSFYTFEQARTLSRVLTAGTYYIQIQPEFNNGTNYNLTVSAPEFTLAPDTAGNTAESARSITLSPTDIKIKDGVGTNFDENDYYSFNISETSTLDLRFSGLNASATVQLLDAGQNLRASDFIVDPSKGGGIYRVLDPGTYYIQVFPEYGTATNYNLAISATPFTLPQDRAGNSRENAREITIGSTASNFTDWLDPQRDSDDYYSFTLTEPGTLNLNISDLNSPTDILLLDANGNTISNGFSDRRSAATVSRLLAAGKYYIQINPRGTTNYSLTASVTSIPVPSDLAGNTLTTARDISVGATPTISRDWIARNIDDNDYYRFTLSEAEKLDLKLSGLTGYALVEILDSSGNLITSSNSATNGGEIDLRRLLTSGTYYIRVNTDGYTGADATNYSLSLSASR